MHPSDILEHYRQKALVVLLSDPETIRKRLIDWHNKRFQLDESDEAKKARVSAITIRRDLLDAVKRQKELDLRLKLDKKAVRIPTAIEKPAEPEPIPVIIQNRKKRRHV